MSVATSSSVFLLRPIWKPVERSAKGICDCDLDPFLERVPSLGSLLVGESGGVG